MKPPSFHYFAPDSLDEVVDLLAEHGEEAQILAGGQSLVPLLNRRVVHPAVLVDINRVEGLDGLTVTDGEVRIGALVRQHTAERSELVQERVPILAEATGYVGHLAVRHRGTVAGSVAFAEPAAELPATVLALGATMVARNAQGERAIAADEFFTGWYQTALHPDELLAEVRVPAPRAGTGAAFVEFAVRDQDAPVCGVAALLTLDDHGRCLQARVALCGVSSRPLRAPAAETVLEDERLDAEVVAEAARRAADDVEFVTSLHASAAYRQRLAPVLTRRALELAVERSERSVA